MFWLSFLIHIPLLSFLAFYFARRWDGQPLQRFYFFTLSLKLISGVMLGIIYIWIYQGASDSIVYFQGASDLNALLFKNPETYFSYIFFNEPNLDEYLHGDISRMPRALFFMKVISVINVFTFNNYWLTSAYFSFFSFLGLYHLSNTIVRIYKIPVLSALVSFLFFPLVVFWSSGILKESILMGTMGLVVSFFLLWINKIEKPGFLRILIFVIFLTVIFALKFYYFAILVPVLLSYFVSFRLSQLSVFKNSAWLHPFIFVFLFFSLIFFVSLLHPLLHPSVFMESLLRNYEATLQVSNGKNVFYFSGLSGSFSSLFLQFPKSVLIGLFRPLPGDVISKMGYLAMLENVFVVIFFVLTVIYLFAKKPHAPDMLLLTAAIMYVLVLSFLLPIASPNWGSLVRYKVGYMPFLLLLITFRNPLILYLESRFLKEKASSDLLLK